MNTQAILAILREGELQLEGRIAWGSNYTLLGIASVDDVELTIIYKPRRGEQPLWDFAEGTLCVRERAAYLLAALAGWEIIPPTILREGPFGYGSVQLFIEHDPETHYFNFQGETRFDSQLQVIVLFDWIANNADRKGGHVLVDGDDKLWGIDHGLCFNVEYKLRSVIWEYAGIPFSAEQTATLTQLRERLGDQEISAELASLLSPSEFEIMLRRLDLLIDAGVFPQPGPDRHYPWPPV